MISTILTRNGGKDQKRFERNDEGILSLKSWVIEENCDVVACEFTTLTPLE
jgi:hypothetical protein